MALGDTFDLARAYGAAESIANARSDRQYRRDVVDLNRQKLELEALTDQERKHLEERYLMWQASAENPALRKQILSEARANDKDGKLSTLDDQTLSSYLDTGFKLRLDLKDEKPDKPAKPEAKTRTITKNGKKVEQSGYFDPETRKYVWTDEAPGWDKPSSDSDGSDKEITSAVPSAISNRLYRQAVNYYGGLIDPDTGQISGLNPDLQSKVADLSAIAERIWADAGGRLSPGEAFQRASKDPGARAVGSRGGERRPAATEAAPAKPAAPPPAPSSPNTAAQQSAPPVSLLREGVHTTLDGPNGRETWTLQAGRAVRVR